MKIGWNAIFFLQRLNLFPRGYIISERTHNFHEISADSPKKSVETFSLRKILSPRKLDKKSRHFVKAWKPLSILERIWWLNSHFIIKKNKKLATRLRMANYENSMVTNIL